MMIIRGNNIHKTEQDITAIIYHDQGTRRTRNIRGTKIQLTRKPYEW